MIVLTTTFLWLLEASLNQLLYIWNDILLQNSSVFIQEAFRKDDTVPTSKNAYTLIEKHTDIPSKINFSLLSPNCILCNMFIDSFLIVLQSVYILKTETMYVSGSSIYHYVLVRHKIRDVEREKWIEIQIGTYSSNLLLSSDFTRGNKSTQQPSEIYCFSSCKLK